MHTDKGNGVGGILHKMMEILENEIPLQEIDQEALTLNHLVS